MQPSLNRKPPSSKGAARYSPAVLEYVHERVFRVSPIPVSTPGFFLWHWQEMFVMERCQALKLLVPGCFPGRDRLL